MYEYFRGEFGELTARPFILRMPLFATLLFNMIVHYLSAVVAVKEQRIVWVFWARKMTELWARLDTCISWLFRLKRSE